jgi:hypothetical protein
MEHPVVHLVAFVDGSCSLSRHPSHRSATSGFACQIFNGDSKVFQGEGSYRHGVSTPACAELAAVYTGLRGLETYLESQGPLAQRLKLKVYVDNVDIIPVCLPDLPHETTGVSLCEQRGALHLVPLANLCLEANKRLALRYQLQDGMVLVMAPDKGRNAHRLLEVDQLARRARKGFTCTEYDDLLAAMMETSQILQDMPVDLRQLYMQ